MGFGKVSWKQSLSVGAALMKQSLLGVLGRLQIRERGDLWIALSKEAARKICDSVAKAIVWWSFLFCTAQVPGNSGRFIDISMTAWAFAKAGMAERVLFGQLASAAMDCSDLPPKLCCTIAQFVHKFKLAQ